MCLYVPGRWLSGSSAHSEARGVDPEPVRMLDGQGSHPAFLTLEDGDKDPWGKVAGETSCSNELWV